MESEIIIAIVSESNEKALSGKSYITNPCYQYLYFVEFIIEKTMLTVVDSFIDKLN